MRNTSMILLLIFLIAGITMFAENGGTCLEFDGVDDYVAIAQNSGLPIYENGTQLTISAWVKATNEHDNRVYSESSTGDNDLLFCLGSYTGGYFRVYIRNASGTVLCEAVSTSLVFDETWHHFCYTDNNGDAHLYIDGVEDATDFSYTRQTLDFNRSTIGGIYRTGLTNNIEGCIDEVHIYNRALTSSEAALEMYLSLDGTETGLVSSWNFNDGSGASLNDVTGHNDGTLYNMDNADWVASDIPLHQVASGSFTSDTIWAADTVYVQNDVTVEDGVTLTINPGVTVSFTGRYKLDISGRLLAIGTEQDSIRFTADASTGWGAIRFYNTPATNDSSKVVHCVLENGKSGGSGYDLYGGAMFFNNVDKVLVKDCTFQNNNVVEGGDGGAIALRYSVPAIYNCVFKNNMANGEGGALFFHESQADVVNCLFQNNSTTSWGGAVSLIYSSGGSFTNCLFDGNHTTSNGGAIRSTCSITVLNCTFVENQADMGGALSFSSGMGGTIRNSILWGNSANTGNQVCVSGTVNTDFHYCDIEGGTDGFGYNTGATWTGDFNNSFVLQPNFRGTGDDPWKLSTNSPCINSGDPATSMSGIALNALDGYGRFYEDTSVTGCLAEALGRVDLGPYENPSINNLPDGTVIDEDQNLVGRYYIYPGFTTIIEPGVTLELATNAEFIVYGNIIADGTADQPITFTHASEYDDWCGLIFRDVMPDIATASHFEYCTIEYSTGDNYVSYPDFLTGSYLSYSDGGIIYAEDYEDLTFVNCRLRYGASDDDGGALYLDNTNLSMTGCVLTNNYCDDDGGAIYSTGSEVSLINCTIADNNNIGTGGALYFSTYNPQPIITNCIIWGNHSSAIVPGSGTLTEVTYSNIQTVFFGTGNTCVDPGFEGSGEHPYALHADSYCINMGTPSTSGLDLPANDVQGNPRIHAHTYSTSDRIDIGAYEYPGYLAPANFTASDGSNEYSGYVQLFWEYNAGYDPEPSGYRVFRNDVSITTLPGQTTSYSDYTAIPGEFYTYYIQAYNGSEIGNSDTDSGYLKPNGVISGTVTTANDNPVSSVQVSLNPSPGYCLQFEDTDNSLMTITDPEMDMNYNYTVEFWVRTPLGSQTVLSRGNFVFAINSSGNMTFTNGINTLTQAADSVDVTDNAWHHVALVNDYTNTVVTMYLDEYEVAFSTTWTLGAGSPGDIVSGPDFEGYLDDIRFWSSARTEDEVVSNMNIIAPVDEDALEGYWTLNEGAGTVFFDGTSNAHNGVIVDGDWSDADPGIELGALTNDWGEYIISQIPYGTQTTFTVTPYKVGHIFQPEQRSVTLSESNIAQNDINFTDNSMIPITGRVVYQGTSCPVEGATIELNGETAVPLITTDEDGYYNLEVEHGENCIVSVSYNDHPFNRTWDLGLVTYPRTNINFEDTFKTNFWLEVVGGEDSYPIGEFDVTVQSTNGCYLDEITDGSWGSGGIMIDNVPPLDFNITIDPAGDDPFSLAIDEQFQNMKTQAIDMTSPGDDLDTLRFEWRAPLEIEVAWPDTLDLHHFTEYPENEFYVLGQNVWYSVTIKAFEDYSYDGHEDQVTWLSDCDLNIFDDIGTQGETNTNFNGETEYTYIFAPYLPNILTGYSRQYQNMLQFSVEDTNLNRVATQSDWALTEGVRPTESTYATTSPEIPFLILHDPPGDGSHSTFSQSSSHTIAMQASVCTNMEHNVYMNIHLGPEFKWETGCAVMSVEHEVSLTDDLSFGFTMGTSQTESMEQQLTFTTNTSYSTSSDSQVIGDGSDLFVGGAVNLIWGVTNEIAWDDLEETVVIDTSVMVVPDGFATVYMYTDLQIRETVIPNLEAIGDTESAALWQSYLEKNEDNKNNAQPNPNHPNNLSFNAGAGYSFEESCQSSETQSIVFSSTVSGGFGVEIGGTVDGIGGETGYKFNAALTIGHTESETNSTTTTTGFTLADNDETSFLNWQADYFTLDVLVDPVYGTPVFDLISGASSNPWEPNTQPRDGVSFSANTYTQNGLLEGEEAAFILTLGNTSQTGEDRRYYLEVMQSTNQNGAEIKINGVPLEGRMAFDVPGGSAVQAIMTVGQGPDEYIYNNIGMTFYAEGDRGRDGPEGHFFWLEKYFNVSWEAPYSRVAINSPQDGWILNQESGDSLLVMLTDYDLDKPDFNSLLFQYKHPSDVDWMPGFEIPRDSLSSVIHYIEYPWDISGISDGIWQIRAGTTDNVQDNYYTDALTGVIDRHGPHVLEPPQPSDGILAFWDVISVMFNEKIDPLSVLYENIEVEALDTGLIIDCEIETFENRIVLTPNIANFWMENKTIRVTVDGVEDLYGNPIDEPVVWEFFVNANPVGWDVTKLEVIKPLGDEMTLTADLINTGGQISSFTIENIPLWLAVNPVSGTLLPLDSETITLTISDQLGFGTYLDTLYANIPGLGMEPLVIEIGVLANPPEWSTQPVGAYDYSMSITGQMSIEGEVSQDAGDVIGAFVIDGQGDYVCRGFAQTELVPYLTSTYAFFLTVQSYVEYGEDLIFRIWDDSECKEHIGITENFTFLEGAVYGTPVTPTVVHAEPELVREISCNQGWTWFSTNLEDQTSMSVNDLLANLNPTTGDLIKNQTEYAQYVEGSGWTGSLTEITTDEMFKIKLTTADHLLMSGLLEDPYATTITYGSGWNWIGYIPHVSVSVGESLADIENLTTGDLIKNQQGFAQYIEGYGWVGSLLFMNPGDGYMLNTQNAGTFHYPDYDLTRGLGSRLDDERVIAEIPSVPGWELDPLDYEYSANITGCLWQDGVELLDSNLVIGAFDGTECRGIASAIEVQGSNLYFLTVYSNDYIDELTFFTYNQSNGEYVDLDEEITIVSNQIIGDPVNPHQFDMPTGQLNVPQNLRITISDGAVNLTWYAVAGAASYNIYSCDDPAAEDESWNMEASVSETSWSQALPAGNRYYRVTASSESVRLFTPLSRKE